MTSRKVALQLELEDSRFKIREFDEESERRGCGRFLR